MTQLRKSFRNARDNTDDKAGHASDGQRSRLERQAYHSIPPCTGKTGWTRSVMYPDETMKRKQRKKSSVCIGNEFHAVEMYQYPSFLTISYIVTSGGERKRIGGPQVPVPRLTC